MENTWQETTLARGDLSLILMPSIGGRLMDVVYKGHSLLFTNPDLKGIHADSVTGELNTFPTRAKHVPFPLWGGEKTWLAPERYWQDKGPIPVLDSAAYHLEYVGSHSVKMTSPKNSDGLVITRTVSLSETVEGQFEIHHQITNQGVDEVKVGCWSVMILQRNATIAYKQWWHQRQRRTSASPRTICKRQDVMGWWFATMITNLKSVFILIPRQRWRIAPLKIPRKVCCSLLLLKR